MYILRKYTCFVFLFALSGWQGSAYAQEKDSLLTKTLNDVIVLDKRPASNGNTSVTQTMDSLHIQQIPSFQLADALKFFSGVHIKDYGGVGGLKTISVRSLGANHTAVAYDGLSVSDCQTGQINLGRFSLENMEAIQLQNDDGLTIFQPARLLASANVLQLFSSKPRFAENKNYNVKVSFRGGSYTLLQPLVLIENKLSKRVSSSFMFDYLYQKGDYPFQIKNGDSSIRTKRSGADVLFYRLEENIFVRINDKQELTAKFFYYHSEQGLPGAVVFYTATPSQRLWDESIFAQVHYQYNIHKKLRYQSNAKWNYSYLRYLDTNYLNVERKLDNRYVQRELYLNNALLYSPFDHWSFSVSNDLSLNTMNASLADFVNPARYTSLTAVSSLFSTRKIQISASVLHTYVYDLSRNTSFTKYTNKFTPSIRMAYKPLEKQEFYIKAFYKQLFRLPTFNDMYYRLVGNVNLKVENVHLFDLGFSYASYVNEHLPYASFSGDFYYNYIKDKIIAVPNKNLFVWSMTNLGKVSILGLDIQANVEWKVANHVGFETTVNYTFQEAIDLTDSTARNYKHQIPYTPKHTGSCVIACKTKWINISYSLLYVGERYVLGQNIPANLLESYLDHGFAFYHTFSIKETKLSLRAEVLNVFNTQYEVIRNFPMAGRQFQGKITYNF